ncbi:unnamed protein product [Ceratitis capitata]|uniref:(Mediterranean fruit fly) hypothetical protein n=1 Tax=Ceratitis capitata TaxID=7213 RepID=A0A811U443_CERCA|nr:unnamed protein product [Ceratitis capitata]
MKIIVIFLVLATVSATKSRESKYQHWKDKTDKKIIDKYDNKQKNYYNRKNKDLMSGIASALARPNLTAAQISRLTSAYSKLSEANQKSLNFKKSAFQSGFYTLLQVLEG